MDNYLTNDEQIQIILRNYQKNKDLEDYAIDELAKRLKNIKTKDEIVKRLKETNYMGTYVVGDSIINDSESEEKDIVGRYYNQAKIIAVSKKDINHEKTIIHEFGHALINDELTSKINIDEDKKRYGIGLEEAACEVLSLSDDISNINLNKFNDSSYEKQLLLSLQINDLYNYIKDAKYNNTYELIFDNPRKYLQTVREIFDVNNTINGEMEEETSRKLSYQLALQNVIVADDITNYPMASSLSLELTMLVDALNSLYLKLLGNAYLGENIKLYKHIKLLERTNEEKLLSTIFGEEQDYINKVLNMIYNINEVIESSCNERNYNELSPKILIKK